MLPAPIRRRRYDGEFEVVSSRHSDTDMEEAAAEAPVPGESPECDEAAGQVFPDAAAEEVDLLPAEGEADQYLEDNLQPQELAGLEAEEEAGASQPEEAGAGAALDEGECEDNGGGCGAWERDDDDDEDNGDDEAASASGQRHRRTHRGSQGQKKRRWLAAKELVEKSLEAQENIAAASAEAQEEIDAAFAEPQSKAMPKKRADGPPWKKPSSIEAV